MTNEDEFECWEQSMEGAFLELLDNWDSYATNKINEFSPQNSSTTVIFQIEFLMEKIENVGAEKYKFENPSKKLKVAFSGKLGLLRQWCKEH